MKFKLLIMMTVLFFSITCSSGKNREEDIAGNGKDSVEVITSGEITVLAGTDELSRVLPLNDGAGNRQPHRQAGLFYFLWQGDPTSPTSEKYYDLSEIMAAHPEVADDFDNPDWGSTTAGKYYFWGKPLYGYYRGDDYWVHLRNIQLLTDAEVDFLVIDATNALVYPDQSETLMQAMEAVRRQGKNPPKIVYYTNTQSGNTMQLIYNEYYKSGAPHCHPSCWYYLDSKPLIIGLGSEADGRDCRSFFTFRESQWPNEKQKPNGWPWIDFTRPQTVYRNSRGEREIINVSVCQHPNPGAGMGGSAFYGNTDNWGRSYRNGNPGNPATEIKYGYNFQEQWDFAISEKVPFIFITGWNEWIAGRWNSTDGNPEHSYFCDAASPEYSRDIEPTRTAGINDNYYMQMVANIRRYKGIDPIPAVEPQTVNSPGDWGNVPVYYTDYTGDVRDRNHPGAESNPAVTYTNRTGRNDFRTLKVAADSGQICFYAQTVAPVTAVSGDNWMRLYIDTDRKYSTGWCGYDFRVDGGKKLLRYSGGEWEAVADVTCKVEKNEMMIIIPLEKLGIQKVDIEFKWSDNMQDDSDPLDWYLNGDVAPGGRFNYVFRLK